MWVQVPAPIQLKEKDGALMKIGKAVEGKVEVVEHQPEALYTFADERLAAQMGTFKEQRVWGRILRALAEAEEKRAAGDVEPWVEIADEDLKFFRDKMEALQMGGHGLRQFAPFMHALEDAKRERPKAAPRAADELKAG